MSEELCSDCGEPITLPYGKMHWLHADTGYCFGLRHRFQASCDYPACLAIPEYISRPRPSDELPK
jgi:hypothetical protein